MINVNEIVDYVKASIGEGAEVHARKCDKGNGVVLDAIGIRPYDSKVEAMFYLNFATDDMDSMQIASRVLAAYREQHMARIDLSPVNVVRDYDRVKEKLFLKLSSCPAENLVKARAFCDIYMTAYIKLFDTCGKGVINVTDQFLDCWGIDKETLFADALANAKKKEHTCLRTMAEHFSIAFPFLSLSDTGSDDSFDPLNYIKILTNDENCNGASAILLRDDLPEEYYLLPSSRHEVIIVPAFEGMDASLFIDMVRYVNATEVDQVDILSDNAYHCVNGVFSIAGDENSEVSL